MEAIQRTIQLADQKHCFVCGGRGAAISCEETGCERSFHLPCAEDRECVTQYFGQHRSFCWEHCPQQAAEAAPSKNTICIICLEPVGDSTSYCTMVCPVCKQAWFHRGCMRKHALHTSTMRFFCPVCRGKARFRSQMTTLGIQIPVSLVEKLGMSSRRMSRDALDLPPAWGTGDSSHSLSSLADDYLGGTMQHTSRREKGTGTAMPARASTQEAGRGRRKRGE
ncbi:hypothetical protein CIB84_005005 [Bambusicola thoracicus]|uniref:PHD-type domain-containing protein n=1 Tax=Bambusicola thoracicus TaxID=9083 RepID=A0A2P4T4J2_BAMTH|nr:hypothetical protein CIB84_005005 [Bambusicola thoracicus]